MGQMAENQEKCCICADDATFYSLYARQEQFFCSSLCHQEYNSRHTDTPNLILVRVERDEKINRGDLHDPPSQSDGQSSADRDSGNLERSIEISAALLFDVVRRGTDEAFGALLLEGGVDVNQADNDGVTLVMVAAGMGAKNKVEMLLEHGAEVDKDDAEGKTALHKCSRWKEDTECARLIHARAPHLVSKQDNFLQTPLHGAAGEGNDALVEFLISEGAVLTTVDNLERTPLHWAIIQGRTSTVDLLLLRHNAKEVIDTGDRFGQRPLHYAVKTNRKDIAEVLIEKNCQLEDSENTGSSMLIYSVKNGDRDMCALIVKHCKDIDSVDSKGWTALHHAIYRGEVGICDLLLSKDPDLNIAEPVQQQTPILLAVNLGHLEILSLLLARGCKIICFEVRKRTPIHCACEKGSTDMLRMLLEHIKNNHQDGGCKCINAKDSSGQTALSTSVSKCDRECCQLLLDNSAKVDEQSKSRLIEMGLIKREVKRSKEDKPKETKVEKVEETSAPVTPRAESEDSEVQWQRQRENKKRMQKAWQKAAWPQDKSTSTYAQDLTIGRVFPRTQKSRAGYLDMYTTKHNPDKLLKPEVPKSSTSRRSNQNRANSFSYSTSRAWKP